jgi:hypothetical protein
MSNYEARTIATKLADKHFDTVYRDVCPSNTDNNKCTTQDFKKTFITKLTVSVLKKYFENGKLVIDPSEDDTIYVLLYNVMDELVNVNEKPNAPVGIQTNNPRHRISRKNLQNIADDVVLNLHEITKNPDQLIANKEILIQAIHKKIADRSFNPSCLTQVDPSTPTLYQHCTNRWNKNKYNDHEECMRFGSPLIDSEDEYAKKMLNTKCTVKTGETNSFSLNDTRLALELNGGAVPKWSLTKRNVFFRGKERSVWKNGATRALCVKMMTPASPRDGRRTAKFVSCGLYSDTKLTNTKPKPAKPAKSVTSPLPKKKTVPARKKKTTQKKKTKPIK